MTDSITLSLEQSKAADAVASWFEDYTQAPSEAPPFFYLAGYAGTGKTTIAKYITGLLNARARFATFTGKAAKVLTSKGCPASTIHSMVYLPLGEIDKEIEALERELHDIEKPVTPERERKIIRRLTELREPAFVLRTREEIGQIGLFVLDECSMIDEPMARDLLSFNIPILVLGDPGQLPPIKGTGYFTTRKPDYLLTEIHRQAAESPVLRLATMARKGERILTGAYGDSKVISRNRFNKEDALSVAQIICGSNKARVALIDEMRKFHGYSGTFPNKGEKLICLRNAKSKTEAGILNGEMFIADSDYIAEDITELEYLLKTDPEAAKAYLGSDPSLQNSLILINDEGYKRRFYIHPECFTDPERVASWSYAKRRQMQEFAFGWAITGHKSQGSQWESVVVYADQFRWNAELFKQWLYTAITRAEKRVVVCL